MKIDTDLAMKVLHAFRIEQTRAVGEGCMCIKCIECMRRALEKTLGKEV